MLVMLIRVEFLRCLPAVGVLKEPPAL